MIVRALSDSHDWTFGKGKNNYLRNNKAIIQNINTRLSSFLGDCFFAIDQGIDWFNLLGGKSLTKLKLDVNATILNTYGVTAIISSSVLLDPRTRRVTLTYTVETIYTGSRGDIVEPNSSSLILTEDGDVLVTEDGDSISAG